MCILHFSNTVQPLRQTINTHAHTHIHMHTHTHTHTHTHAHTHTHTHTLTHTHTQSKTINQLPHTLQYSNHTRPPNLSISCALGLTSRHLLHEDLEEAFLTGRAQVSDNVLVAQSTVQFDLFMQWLHLPSGTQLYDHTNTKDGWLFCDIQCTKR